MKSDKNVATGTATAVGIVPTVVNGVVGVMEKATRASFFIAREVHTEMHHGALATIDWVDHAQKGTLRISRELVNRVEHLSSYVLTTTEEINLRVLALVHQSSHAAIETTSVLANRMIENPIVANGRGIADAQA